ncbi:MAG: OmpA family protein [Desulfovibrionaceae bacterium]
MPKKVQYVKKPAEQPPANEGLPEWMATFADMVTLLLCFFVLLLSFAKQDVEKFRDALGSIRNAFGTTVVRAQSDTLAEFTTSDTQDETAAPSSQAQVMMDGVIVRIKSLLDEDPDNQELKKHTGIDAEREGVRFSASTALLYEPGTAKLTPEAYHVLDDLATVLKEYNLYLVVRGHTNDLPPPPGSKYPTNWELSSARAAVVLAYLTEYGGIEEKRLKAVGYAGTQPLAPNTSPENRAKNERVEFFLHLPEKTVW